MSTDKCAYALIDLTVKPPKIMCEAQNKEVPVHQFQNRCTVPNCYVCKYFMEKYKSNEVHQEPQVS